MNELIPAGAEKILTYLTSTSYIFIKMKIRIPRVKQGGDVTYLSRLETYCNSSSQISIVVSSIDHGALRGM